MKNFISYFVHRHMLTNVIFFGLLIAAVFSWVSIGKEEMPEFESNWIRVSTIYPGAPAEDVELFVTKPLEEELKGVVGIEEIVTTSSVGISSIRITLDDYYPDKDEVVQDIKDAILRADLPSEVRDLPQFRQFKSEAKAILDIGIYHKQENFLDAEKRAELQKYILSFESQLLALQQVSSIERSHYRKPELQILADPDKVLNQEISLSEISNQIRQSNIRVPIGSMKDSGESKVTALNELEDPESLKALILRGNYQGQKIRLGELAKIQNGFEESTSIFKINGHEGVFLNVRKNVSTDILTAQEAVTNFIARFKKANKDAPIDIVLMDDESYAVTNRLNIVSSNGLIGFILIIIVLLLFLDLKSGFWVGMGIPFSIAFTLIIAHIYGYTVNNMTLAGIIIVLGIVVDDAIIVAENISRYREEGLSANEASIKGTSEVIKPIFASIITTCVAFMPLMYFEGFFGKLVAYIPLIIILMLIGSLIESITILPAHLAGKTPFLERFAQFDKENWFRKYERAYAKLLLTLINKRAIVFSIFILLLGSAAVVFKTKMKFVMFPREESQEVFIKVKAQIDYDRHQTARAIAPLEQIFIDDKNNVVAARSSIALSRRGGEVRENEASILVELFPRDDRETPMNVLLADWEAKAEGIAGLDEVKFLRGRWGHASGNAIEIRIQENNDESRQAVAEFIAEKMKQIEDVVDVEIEEPLVKKEYLFRLNQDNLIRYNVSAPTVTATLRSFVEGSILYSINKGDEEIDVRLTVPAESKSNLKALLNLRVENNQGSLVYLKNLVEINEVQRPVNITRADFKRATMLYANPNPKSKVTPLQIAERLEESVFPEIQNKFPTTIISFKGEIEDTRESQGEFLNAVLLVVILIYFILIIMFNSLTKPFLVLAIVPFGVAGVVFVLMAHGMQVYGFFAAVGALGMIGVVINDAIVMIDKIERSIIESGKNTFQLVADIASTRLRPVILTTLTTVIGVLPTAYGVAGYDSMLAEMMLTMGWGLAFGTVITLILIPCLYSLQAKPD